MRFFISNSAGSVFRSSGKALETKGWQSAHMFEYVNSGFLLECRKLSTSRYPITPSVIQILIGRRVLEIRQAEIISRPVLTLQ